MKKYLYYYGLFALFLILALPVMTRAQEDGDQASAGVSANASATIAPPPPPSTPSDIPTAIGQRLRDEYDTHAPNGVTPPGAEDPRNAMIQQRGMAGSSTFTGSTTWNGDGRPPYPPMMGSTTYMGSSTRGMPPFGRPGEDGRPDMRNGSSTWPMGSSTMMAYFQGRKQDFTQIRFDIFKRQQDNIVHELTVALDNLTQIRRRIESRIEKAQASSTDVSDAQALLVTADAKLALAQQAVNALSAFTPSATSTASMEASTTIDLGKPRQIGSDAINAIKDAKDALNAVVQALAHDLGVPLPPQPPDGGPASSTPPAAPSTATTTP